MLGLGAGCGAQIPGKGLINHVTVLSLAVLTPPGTHGGQAPRQQPAPWPDATGMGTAHGAWGRPHTGHQGWGLLRAWRHAGSSPWASFVLFVMDIELLKTQPALPNKASNEEFRA